MHKKFFINIYAIFIVSLISCSSDHSWLPENSEIVFTSNVSGNSEIYLKKGTDTTWINLSQNEAGDNWPVWSPDGKKVLFQNTRNGKLDIWIMNKDGSEQKQLTTNEEHDYLPSFTPDGKKITFTSWRTEREGEERSPHIYIMNSDGSDQKRLIEESLKTSAGASWHPDGEKFLFTKKVREIGADIFEADKFGKIIRQLTNDTLYSGGAEYSPDGSKIIFTQDYGDSTNIIIMNSDGTNLNTLIKGGMNYYPHFSPDGNWIIYTKIIPDTDDKDLDIYAISIEDNSKEILLVRSEKREAEGKWYPVNKPN